MKDKLVKRRNHINWKKVLDQLEDFLLNKEFWLKKCNSHISDNRLAYLVLLHYYDKKILDYYRFTGDIQVFVSPFVQESVEGIII